MHEAGDKHCLAGTTQTGHGKTHGRAFGEFGKIKRA
jgi:hypothetical protein